jgi:PEP-CTERM motif
VIHLTHLKKGMNMKIKLKTLLAPLVIAASFFVSVSANAADINSFEALSFIDGTADFGSSFTVAQRGQTFEDQMSFTTVGFNDLDSAVISISTNTRNGYRDLDVTGFSLFDGLGNLVTAGTQSSTGAMDIWSISVTNLPSIPTNSYWLQVNGTVVGNGGSYGGNANMVSAVGVVSAVPEPETYAMMLAGLGLMGAVARRRKAKQA